MIKRESSRRPDAMGTTHDFINPKKVIQLCDCINLNNGKYNRKLWIMQLKDNYMTR